MNNIIFKQLLYIIQNMKFLLIFIIFSIVLCNNNNLKSYNTCNKDQIILNIAYISEISSIRGNVIIENYNIIEDEIDGLYCVFTDNIPIGPDFNDYKYVTRPAKRTNYIDLDWDKDKKYVACGYRLDYIMCFNYIEIISDTEPPKPDDYDSDYDIYYIAMIIVSISLFIIILCMVCSPDKKNNNNDYLIQNSNTNQRTPVYIPQPLYGGNQYYQNIQPYYIQPIPQSQPIPQPQSTQTPQPIKPIQPIPIKPTNTPQPLNIPPISANNPQNQMNYIPLPQYYPNYQYQNMQYQQPIYQQPNKK